MSETRPASRWRQAMASVVFYLLAGPLLASLAIMLGMLVASLLDKDPESAAMMLAATPFFIFFGYIFGFVPAAFTGFAIGWYRHRIHRWWHVLLAGLAGAAISVACFAVFLYVFKRPRESGPGLWTDAGTFEQMEAAWLLAIPGFVAAIFCAWWQRRESRLPQAADDADSLPRPQA